MDESDIDSFEALEKLGPNLLIIANIVGCGAALLLLNILSMTRLHSNCKFLLSSWCFCFLAQFIIHIIIFALDCSMDELPKTKADPPVRLTLYTIVISTQLIATVNELCIAFERLISSIQPDKYYRRSLDRKMLFPVAFAICGSIAYCQNYITKGGNHILVSIIDFSVIALTIAINSYAIRYCAQRYEQLQGKTTLNARYQVKESSQLAVAMQPVYICSFTLKIFLFAPILVFCYETNEEYDCVSRWFYIPFAYMELAYFSTLCAASIFMIACLIRIHPRLWRKAQIISQKLRGVTVTIEPSEGFVMQERANEGDVYFEKLNRSWDERKF